MSRRESGCREIILVCASAVLACASVTAQTSLDPRVNMMVSQDGRMLDANPQLYGSRFNAPAARPLAPLMGNLQATGLAGHGFSLRAPNTIPYVGEFRAPLGSATLSTFRRDSVSVLSAPLGTVPLDRPYFDPARTAPTAGMLRYGAQYYAPTPGLSAPPAATPAQPSGLAGNILGLTPARTLDQPLAVPAIPAANPVSSIFGVPPAEPPRLNVPTFGPTPWGQRDTPADAAAIPDGRAAGTSPLDLRVPPTSDLIAEPLSGIFRPELYPPFGRIDGSTAPAGSPPGWIVPPRDSSVAAVPQPKLTDPSVLPGFDVFTDMQLAVNLLADPSAAWFQEMQAAIADNPQLAAQVDAEIARDAATFLQQALEAPLRTFTSPGGSAVNDLLARAEANMELGYFAEAEDRYRQAQFADPRNPLPIIGLAHALLAQGSYNSAARELERAVSLAELTPGLAPALFRRLDLTGLMGGGEIVDKRRADLMRELESRDRPELRFLLGYLEYHTGDLERGMANLERAAEHPLASRVIVEYPKLLQSPRGSAPTEDSSGPAPGTPVPDVPAEELVVPPAP